ncbi:MAG TPA: GGDEF domain-containing protein [Acidimicrobiales bacterium]|jgi:diguanylate cyclase (GGDEF)-like protein|nr:GGDEF domain-containing protein [Acidimicrobiales bacterium]
MTDIDPIVDLATRGVIDLVEPPEPSLTEITCSPSVRRAAARALEGLEGHRPQSSWVAVCTTSSEIIATSPSCADSLGEWTQRVAQRWDAETAPLAVACLDGDDSLATEQAAAAAELVTRSLNEIVAAEYRAAIATARAGRAEALAATDALTGLANQRAWWDRIAEEDARLARSEATAVIAVIDLDDLKVVNDERGHLHGDLLLRLAGVTLRRAVRACDVVARVGGDEFAVLAVDYDGDPTVLYRRITTALAAADIQASVGVAVPTGDASLLDAYARADEAMYARKHRNRSSPGESLRARVPLPTDQ